MGDRAFFMALSDEVCDHLAVAIRLYRNRQAERGQRVPDQLADVELEVSGRSRTFQDVPRLDEFAFVVEPESMTDLLTYTQTAARLNMSRSTLRRRVEAGDITPVHIGRLARFRTSDIDDYRKGLG